MNGAGRRVSLEHLWAGWRSEYVNRLWTLVPFQPDPTLAADDDDEDDDDERCVFCRIAASGPPSADNGVPWRGERDVRRPQRLSLCERPPVVMPIRHVGELADLAEDGGGRAVVGDPERRGRARARPTLQRG